MGQHKGPARGCDRFQCCFGICKHSGNVSISPAHSPPDVTLILNLKQELGGVPGETQGGQDQHHEDQEYVDLGHHGPVFP